MFFIYLSWFLYHILFLSANIIFICHFLTFLHRIIFDHLIYLRSITSYFHKHHLRLTSYIKKDNLLSLKGLNFHTANISSLLIGALLLKLIFQYENTLYEYQFINLILCSFFKRHIITCNHGLYLSRCFSNKTTSTPVLFPNPNGKSLLK